MLFQNAGLDTLLLFAVSIIIAITLHEFAHGLVAMWNGDYTAKYNGRLTLNPVAHFNITGFLMLMIVGFGYAKPVPVNPNNFKKLKVGIFTVAIAGITLNLLLAFFSTGLLTLTWSLAVSNGTADTVVVELFTKLFAIMAIINVNLALFNLLPIYPLDGFRVLESFTRFTNPVTKFLRDYGQYILLMLIVLSVFVRMLSSRTFIPEWLDFLGFYITELGELIRKAFGLFWGLFAGGGSVF